MDWDVVVIGAGPAGCFTAMQIARSGFKVLILEEHQEIGKPVQCSGLISPRAFELAGADKSIIINHLTGLRILSSLGADLHVKSSHVLALAIDRAAFDKELAAKAENAGAVLIKGLKAKGISRISGGLCITAAYKNKPEITITAKLMIGADGADSDVADWLGLKCHNRRAVMFAADVKLQNPDISFMSIFPSKNFAPGWFGWVIPLDYETSRVGTGYALVQPEYSPRRYFQQLTDYYPQIFKDIKILRYTGGTIPLGSMPKIYTSNAMLVGDAACQTKPISGGGIYMGLKGAQICAKTAAEALSEDNLSDEKLSRYQMLWEKEMDEETNAAMKLRESYLDFDDGDIDLIIRFLSKTRCHKLILKNADIDYPSRLAKKLISISPRNSSLFKKALKIAGNINLI